MKFKSIVVTLLIMVLALTITQSAEAQNRNNKSLLNAAFLASEYTIIAGECIDFTDWSDGNPTYWRWSFPGSENPISFLQNPTGICYLVPGIYNVTLEVQNSTDVDQEFVEGCITVLPNTEFPIANFTADYVVIPAGEFVTFTDLSQNNPVLWNWVFEGGIPDISNAPAPPPIAYLEPGYYDVYLRIEDENGQESQVLRENYIRVIAESSILPGANFLANRTFIAPEELINFTDLTIGSPYKWTWYFEGGTPSTSNEQHPTGIQYLNPGTFRVQLTVENSLGQDELIKDEYIVVSFTDPCTSAPIPQFKASQRLIRHSTKVFFEDQSLNDPTQWNWYFEGGYPTYSALSNPISGIEYNWPGIYRVSLAVNNQCGSNLLVKHDYMFVFSGPVPKYCDTITNIKSNENLVNMSLNGSWGHIGGHNGQRTRTYADKFEQYSFTTLEGIIVPVYKADNGTWNSKITFFVWDGNTTYPEADNVLYQKDVLIRNINANFYNLFEFENPITIEGPFFIGYRINYVDTNDDGISDDRFVVSVAQNRNYWGAENTLYVEHNNTWLSAPAKFGIHTSTGIRPVTCIVDVSEFEIKHNISLYPNPASSYVNINPGELSYGTNVSIQMIDMTGRIVYSEIIKTTYDEISINTSTLPEGLYFVSLVFDNDRITKKLMIMH